MRSYWIAVALVCAFSGLALAQEQDELPPASEELSPEVQERGSYAVGYDVGSHVSRLIKQQSLPLLVEGVIRGFRDALDGKEPAYSEDELRNASDQLQRAALTRLAMKNKEEGQAFLEKNAKKRGVVTLDSGLQYEVIKKGNGPTPSATDTVRTHYHGTFIDGTVFDSSVKAGEPAIFEVSGVIPAWTEALQLMKVGDKWKLYVPSDLAYGVNGMGGIPPNAVLIFEVELLGIER